jgi:uncharacterized protein
MTYLANPIQTQERNKLIDVLRSFALLGVLIANLEGFVTFALPEENIKRLMISPADKLTEAFITFFVENKFITLFSLLFGYGFGVLIERIATKGILVASFFMRRMFILLLIGLLHICFWWGEILSTYALCGMLLLLFRKVGNRGLLVWGAVLLFIIGPLIQGLKWFLLPDPSVFRDQLFKNYLQAIYSGNLLNIAEYNYKIVDFLFIERWSQFRDMAEILGKFLFGYYILRKNIFFENTSNIQALKKTQLFTLSIACIYVAEKATSFFSETEFNNKPLQLIQYIFERAGILSLSLFYAASIALLYYKRKTQTIFNAFQPAGMMSLTNYLTHTIFYALLYYGIGFGQMGKIRLQWTIPIGVAIYGLQVMFSKFWMKKMRYGPVEWIWRQATYGKILPLKRKN